jgi:hypothetical protein
MKPSWLFFISKKYGVLGILISLTLSTYKSRKGILHFNLQIIKILGYIDATIGEKKN